MNQPNRGETPHNQPHEEYIFDPWSFNVDRALEIITKDPRLTRPIPVDDWAIAFSLPGVETPNTIPLLGIGPDFDVDYAMTTDLENPVLIATLVNKSGEASPLFIDGMHRLYRAYHEGVAELPAYVLTATETMSIRTDRYLG